jgi:hypothetical protein
LVSAIFSTSSRFSDEVSMLNSTTLEVAIGMALIYLLLSLFCTAINEGIAGILGSRAKNLEKGIKSLFTDGLKTTASTGGNGAIIPAVTLAEAIYGHGLVQSLYKSTASERPNHWFNKFGSSLPSYIPARTFSSALLDILFPSSDPVSAPAVSGANAPGAPVVAAAGPPATLSTMLASVQTLPDGKGKEAILALVGQAGGDIAKTRQAFENWFNDGMDRAAGWYKRKTQLVLFFIGLIIAVCLNVDSIRIGRALWASPAFRSYAVAAAEQYAGDKSKTMPDPNASKDLAVLQSLALPIGYNTSQHPWLDEPGASPMIVLAGWLLTAIAMTLGAPFWFDTLNKFMVVRSTIKPQEKSGVEASKDA